MDYLTVELREDSFFHLRVYREIGIIGIEGGYLSSFGIFFSEAIERGIVSSTSTIERTFNRYHTIQCVVLHIVGEYHQLSDINEATELFIWKASLIHSSTLGDHPPHIIGLFYLNEAER